MILKDSRGVAAILVAMMVFALIGLAGFTIDLGYYFFTRFMLQNTADAAALAAIRDVDNAVVLVNEVLQNNALNPANLEKNELQIGEWDKDSRSFTVKVDPDPSRRAVSVSLQKKNPTFFARLLGITALYPTGKAVSAFVGNPKAAVVTVGSTAVNIGGDPDNNKAAYDGLLGGLLGIHLDLVGYKGLYYGQIDLVRFLNLAKIKLNTGDIDTVLNAEVSLLDILDLALGALREEDVTARLELESLKLQVAALKLKLRLGDLIEIDLNDKSKLVSANVNLLQMITATAELFNHKNAVLSGVNVNLGVVDVALKVKVVEPPVIKIVEEWSPLQLDPTKNTIHTGQVRLFLDTH
ncbi:MAG: hypothetical protein HGA78_08065, partial [Nitrospirales bacterium]|nr:hypothetical protein [Nitrospirales bacterium]